MKKFKTAVVGAFALALAATCLAACDNDSDREEPKTLSAPEIVLNDNFSVSWQAVAEATSYVVNVNGDDLKAQEALTFNALTAVNSYTVKVKAKNDEAVSDYSAPITYSVHGVTLGSGEGYELHGADTVYGGKDYTFTLEITSEAYEATALTVKANDTLLTEADGKYTVKNVSSDLNITVSGVEKKTYAVTIPAGEGYEVTGAAKAVYGGNYTFTLTLNEAYSNSAPIVKCNGNVLTEKDGKYTVENVTGALEITVENVELNTYTAKIAEGEGFTVAGDRQKSVNHGSSVQFTIAAKNASDVIKVFNGSAEVIGENGVYTLENVAADVTLTVKVYDLSAQLLLADNWDDYEGSVKTENAAENSISVRGWQFGISAAYIQKAVEAGYTHLRFDYALQNMSDAATPGIYMEGQGTSYCKYYSNQNTARFDLTALKKDGAYAKIWMQGRNAEAWGDAKDMSLTVTNPTLFKSTETASWNKDGRNSIYCAEEENGFIVLDTVSAGNDAHILSSTEWWAKYANNAQAGGVGQRTVILSGKYLYTGENNRGAVFGGAGSGVGTVGGTANTAIVTEYMNNVSYTEGNQFYYGLDKEGVYALNVNEFVSNRNSSGGFKFEYISENSFKATMIVTPSGNATTGNDLVNVNLQKYIEAGYKFVSITVSAYTNGQLYVGNGAYGESGYMLGLNSESTQVLDLSKFTAANPNLVIAFAANSATKETFTITYDFFAQ